MMQRATNRELADQLLMEWHGWSDTYRPSLGVPGCSPECRSATSSRQWDSATDITDDLCRRTTMEAVQFCYDAIEFAYQNAIGIEMKNREAKARVWRTAMGKTYEQAIEVIMPVMRRKGLFD